MEAWKIIRATISLAHELGMSVVAEGIETAAIARRLTEVGCDIGQGWYFGRAMTGGGAGGLAGAAGTRPAADRRAGDAVIAAMKNRGDQKRPWKMMAKHSGWQFETVAIRVEFPMANGLIGERKTGCTVFVYIEDAEFSFLHYRLRFHPRPIEEGFVAWRRQIGLRRHGNFRRHEAARNGRRKRRCSRPEPCRFQPKCDCPAVPGG